MLFVTAILFVSIFFIYGAFKNVSTNYQAISDQLTLQQHKRVALNKMFNSARERSLILLQMLAEKDDFVLDELNQSLSADATDFMQARSQFMELKITEQERDLMAIQNALTAKNAPLQLEVANLLIGHERNNAVSLLLQKAIPGQNQVLAQITKIDDLGNQSEKALVSNIESKIKDSEFRFSLVLFSFIAFVLFILVYLQRISRNEQRLLLKNLDMQKEVSSQLRISEERLHTFTDALSTFTFLLSSEGRIELVNKTAIQQTGLDIKDVQGLSLYESYWWDFNVQAVENLKADLKQAATGEKIEREMTLKFGENQFMEVNFIITPIFDSTGNITNLVAEAQDITERQKIAKKISYQASHDALTGLINRYEFERRLSLLLQRAQNNEIHYVFYLDLDQFKIVNDTCGHSAGDELLRQVPKIIQPHVRSSDTLARLGGDEFAVLFENSNYEAVINAAKSMIRSIGDYQFYWQENSFRIGVSIGIVEIDADMTSADEVLKWTDSACYAAKDTGRNTYHFYTQDDELLQMREKEMGWISRIEQALNDERFVLYAQPIVPVIEREGKFSSYEILVRIQNDDGSLIPPGAFLPAAERYGKVTEIDRWVFKKALSTLASCPKVLANVEYFSINVSAQSMTDYEFLQFVLRLFDEYQQVSSKICIEITETTIISNMTDAIFFIEELRKLRVRFALDDFGSGLSSFGYLKNLPVDYLKIDGVFVKDICEDSMDLAMVKSIHEVATVVGLKTVAEFVENDEILKQLKDLGIDFVQGYGIGKPQPLLDLCN